MKDFRILALLLLALAASSCKDQEVRTYLAAPADAPQPGLYSWLDQTVLPGLRAYCDLERNVYDRWHAADVPNLPSPPRRYCPAGGTEPVPPPQPPGGW